MAMGTDDFIYPDPRSPGHVREVLRRIQERSATADGDIVALDGRLDAIEANAGPLTLTFDSATAAGQPVYVTPSGSAELANAGAAATHGVAGLALAAVAAAGTGQIVTDGRVLLSDWTAVTGAASLTPGARYFLGTTDGGLSTSPPSGDGEFIVEVGRAITAAILDIDIQPSIRLNA